jgi:hypothetical protein
MGKFLLLGLLMFISVSVIPMADASPSPSNPPTCYHWEINVPAGNHIADNIPLNVSPSSPHGFTNCSFGHLFRSVL